MNSRPDPRSAILWASAWHLAALLFFAFGALSAGSQERDGSRVVLDRVVAVVNSRAILVSELNDEMRVSILEQDNGGRGRETPQDALQRLIERTLIRQQIREEEERSLVPTEDEVSKRLGELRKRLPVCVHADCASDAGWNEFLAAHGLTQQRVESYLRNRIEILKFIEIRFRQGIHISPEQIEAYYRETLSPQYPPGRPVPALNQVSARIEEILLQRQVNALFSDWLDNLRKQGDIEVLDPSLEAITSDQVSTIRGNPVRQDPL